MRTYNLALVFASVILALVSFSAAAQPRQEFRAAWVATVANIDWPSQRGLSAEQQSREIVEIVAKAKSVGLNALILQVRPVADAIYPSALEPWSEFLSGTQGLAPQCERPPCPAWDPLQTWITTAHANNIQIHAWFNPYRAGHPEERSPKDAGHVSKRLGQAVKTYGTYLWMDPSDRKASEHSLAVIRDVLTRYDIDGVHIDDYFYPYPINAVAGALDAQDVFAGPSVIDFPDEQNWQSYTIAGGTMSKADWRRSHVNQFVHSIYELIRTTKPKVSFGISPFGVGKPSLRPEGIKGFSQYDSLYADVELWLEQGWLDYLAPQLYWKRDSTNQGFEPLLNYWLAQNKKSKNIWAGLYTSRTKQEWPAEEIAQQILLLQNKAASNPTARGHIHFSMKAIVQNYGGIADQLRLLYKEPAVVPEK